MDSGSRDDIFITPQHDYTKRSIDAEPSGRPEAVAETADRLVTAQDVRVWFALKRGLLQRTYDHVKAVNGVSFEIKRGETLGIVGESGSGKTTLGRALLALQPAEGAAHLGDTNILTADKRLRRALRKDMQIVFQDPYGA